MIIQNIKLTNCGMRDAYFSLLNYPGQGQVTISLFNVYSVVLSNTTFENSLGHGIVGINVLGTSTLVNITVYHNNNLSGNSLTPIGGIILVYVDTIDDVHHNQTQSENNVIINNCTICCMTGQSSFEKSSTIPNAILGFLFSQQKYLTLLYQILLPKVFKLFTLNMIQM